MECDGGMVLHKATTSSTTIPSKLDDRFYGGPNGQACRHMHQNNPVVLANMQYLPSNLGGTSASSWAPRMASPRLTSLEMVAHMALSLDSEYQGSQLVGYHKVQTSGRLQKL